VRTLPVQHVVAVFTHFGTAGLSSDSRRAVNPTTPLASTRGTTSRCRSTSTTPLPHRPLPAPLCGRAGTAKPAATISSAPNPHRRRCSTSSVRLTPPEACPTRHRTPAGVPTARSANPRSRNSPTTAAGRSASSRTRYQPAASSNAARRRASRVRVAASVMPVIVGSHQAGVTRPPRPVPPSAIAQELMGRNPANPPRLAVRVFHHPYQLLQRWSSTAQQSSTPRTR